MTGDEKLYAAICCTHCSESNEEIFLQSFLENLKDMFPIYYKNNDMLNMMEP